VQTADNLASRNWWRALVLLVCLLIESTLLWYNFHRPVRHAGLLTTFTFALLFGLNSTAVIPVPNGIRIPFFGVWPSLADSTKAAISFVLIFLWTPTAKQLVPDSLTGAVIILAPDALFLVAALIYLSNGLSR
jgi:hypothetical protein